jgi:hypothetical protein
MYVGCLYIFSGESSFFLSSLKLLQGARIFFLSQLPEIVTRNRSKETKWEEVSGN